MDIQKKKVTEDKVWSVASKTAAMAALGVSAVSLSSCADPKPVPLAGDVAIPVEQVETPADSNDASLIPAKVDSNFATGGMVYIPLDDSVSVPTDTTAVDSVDVL